MSRDQHWVQTSTYLREGVSRLRVLAVISLLTSLWLLAAPLFLGYPGAYPGVRAWGIDLGVGFLGLCLASVHALNWRTGRWGSKGVLYLGLFLFAAPIILGYYHAPGLRPAAVNDMICGALLGIGAILSLAGSEPAP